VHYPAALDHCVVQDTVIGNVVRGHSLDGYMAQKATAVVIGEAMRGPSNLIPTGREVAKDIDPMFYDILLQFAYVKALAGQIPANERERRQAFLRAREMVADDAVANWESAIDELQTLGETNNEDDRQRVTSQLTAVETHPDRAMLLNHAGEHLRGKIPDRYLCLPLVQIASSWPLPPYNVEKDPDDDALIGALSELLSTIRKSTGPDSPAPDHASALQPDFARMVLESRDYGARIMGDKDGNPLPWILAGGGLVLLAATGIGLAVVGAGTAAVGAAAITSTLASFGPGGMVGGIATVSALVGTGSALTASGIAASLDNESEEQLPSTTALLTKMSPEQLRHLLGTAIGGIHLEERLFDEPALGRRSSFQLRLSKAKTDLSNQRNRHLYVEKGTSDAVKLLDAKIEVIEKAERWLQQVEIDPAASSQKRERRLGARRRQRAITDGGRTAKG
jgi:hypothetical protein